MEKWNQEGRKRMDDLLKPGTNMLPEERVMYTMELQSDIEGQVGDWFPTYERRKNTSGISNFKTVK